MSGPWMTSTSASSVPTCATDTAGVTMDTAGQHFTHGHLQIKLAEVVFYYFFNISQSEGQYNKYFLTNASEIHIKS